MFYYMWAPRLGVIYNVYIWFKTVDCRSSESYFQSKKFHVMSSINFIALWLILPQTDYNREEKKSKLEKS